MEVQLLRVCSPPQVRDGGHPEGSQRRPAANVPAAQRGARRLRQRALRARVRNFLLMKTDAANLQQAAAQRL